MHILASLGYAPGTIAVNVTWMERGFNAGQTHCNIYQSKFNRLRDIGWKLQLFPTPLAFKAPDTDIWSSEKYHTHIEYRWNCCTYRYI